MEFKTFESSQLNHNAERVKRLFSFMNVTAWLTLGIGILMTLWSLDDFSDRNLTLMLGIGFMVGSVFIYTIGTAIHLVHKRAYESNDEFTE